VPSDSVSSLVKFCTIDSGIKILSSQALRWSAPHLFGDPFELHYQTTLDLSSESLLDVLLREALIMLFGPDVPTGRNNRLVNIMARWREQERFCDEQEADTVLRELLGQIAEIQAHQVEEYMREWQSFARNIRITCFSEKPGNIPCWQRFASNHRGVALRFNCGDDSALPKPQRVTYHQHAPLITHQREQLEVIYGRRGAPTKDEFPEKLLLKGRQDHLEQEWRCIDRTDGLEDEDHDQCYDARKFPAHELRAVYFGVFTAESDKQHIAKLVRTHYPTAKIYQAEAPAGRYELDFVSWQGAQR
jgi:hypothetical protein